MASCNCPDSVPCNTELIGLADTGSDRVLTAQRALSPSTCHQHRPPANLLTVSTVPGHRSRWMSPTALYTRLNSDINNRLTVRNTLTERWTTSNCVESGTKPGIYLTTKSNNAISGITLHKNNINMIWYNMLYIAGNSANNLTEEHSWQLPDSVQNYYYRQQASADH